MTPFGQQVRQYRSAKSISLKKMSEDLGVTPAYFSALEHGHRGRPGSGLVQQICGYFDLMWDEAEDIRRLAELSHPRVVVDTAGLSPKATHLANLLAERISKLDEQTIEWVLAEIESREGTPGGPTY